MKPGKQNLITDIEGLYVGNSHDDGLRSGATVLVGDKPFVASVHVMGGSPGTRETDLLAPDKVVKDFDALVLAGGSAFGLDACSGVVDGLHSAGRGTKMGEAIIPLVPGAILFDLLNGGRKAWDENPYRQLGKSAFATAAREFELGSVGAGAGAVAGDLKGGLGSASLVMENGVTVAALVAVNSIGSVTTPGDRHFWGAPFEIDGEFGGCGPDMSSGLGRLIGTHKAVGARDALNPRANTTIAIVATDALLTKAECQRCAVSAHDGIARAVVPAHTPGDGDLVFAASTGKKVLTDPKFELLEIGHAASVCLSRAICRAVYLAKPMPGDLFPCWSDTRT